MDKLKGSMETLSAMQLTADIEGLDTQSKTILRNIEVLAVILQGTVAEYQGYSRKEIMGFIEADSITNEKEVSPGRTNTQIKSDQLEFIQLNEKASLFDFSFLARNPLLSTENILISLHVDVESQKTYKPGYPIEKRGIYYLARRLSSQLSFVTEKTNYGQLEKCYSIWICRDDVPVNDRYTISAYEMSNTKNTGALPAKREDYDLMTLVVIKLGNKVYNGKKEDDGYDLLRFLNAIMYPHKDDFIKTVSEYIDFSENEELWEEVTHMDGLGECIYNEIKEEVTEEITEKVTKEVTERVTEEVTERVTEEVTERVTEEVTERVTEEVTERLVQALILDNLEEQVSMERIITKLQKFLDMPEEMAKQYCQKFASKA